MIENFLYIDLPNRLVRVREISLTRQTVELTERFERPSRFDALNWPDLSCPKHDHSDIGLDSQGRLTAIDETLTVEDMTERILTAGRKHIADFTGYLSVYKGQSFCVTDGWTLICDHGDVRKLTTVPVVKAGWFYGPKKEGKLPIKNQIFLQPYTLDLCWVSKTKTPLAHMNWIKEFIRKHAKEIADPFMWKECKHDLYIVEMQQGQYVILGEK